MNEPTSREWPDCIDPLHNDYKNEIIAHLVKQLGGSAEIDFNTLPMPSEVTPEQRKSALCFGYELRWTRDAKDPARWRVELSDA